jgi:hypothetical protein
MTTRRKSTKRSRKTEPEDTTFHQVKGILDEKYRKGNIVYLIDWAGTDPKGRPYKPTWVRERLRLLGPSQRSKRPLLRSWTASY